MAKGFGETSVSKKKSSKSLSLMPALDCEQLQKQRIRTGNAPLNLALLKRWSLNLLNQETSFKRSTCQKAKRASMDVGYLLKVLAASIPLQSNLSSY